MEDNSVRCVTPLERMRRSGSSTYRRRFGFFVSLAFLVVSVAMAASPARTSEGERTQTQAQSSDEAQDQLEQTQARLQALENDVEILTEVTDIRLKAQDQHVANLDLWTGQQANYMAAISNVTTWVGGGITLIALVAGFIVYFSMKGRASEEAREAADHWFRQNTRELSERIDVLRADAARLQSQIDELQSKAQEARGKIESQAQEAHGRINLLTTEIDDHVKQFHEGIDKAGDQILALRAKDKAIDHSVQKASVELVQQASIALKDKPENEFTSDDHYARGLNEYQEGRFESALLSFDEAIRKAQLESIPDEHHAKLMNARALAVFGVGREEEGIAILEEIDRKYRHSRNPLVREQVARALNNKGATYTERNESNGEKNNDAVEVYDQVVSRYGGDTTAGVRAWVATALLNKGVDLRLQGRDKDAIDAYDDVESRYSADRNTDIRDKVAAALFAKGYVLHKQGRGDDAIPVYTMLEERYAVDTGQERRVVVAEAIFNKSLVLSARGDLAGAIAACDSINLRYGEDANSELRERVVQALLRKSDLLNQSGQIEEALASLAEVENCYASDTNANIQEWVRQARALKILLQNKQ